VQGRGGLPKDEKEAARLYELAADQGNAAAQCNLGVFYEDARGGLEKDENEAARLYKLAADQGNSEAQCYLGDLYAQGRGGLPKDKNEAVRLYKLAVDQGNTRAQAKLRDSGYSKSNKTAVDGILTGLDSLIKWASCPHGLLAGKYKDRCEKCVQDREELEREQERQREKWLQERKELEKEKERQEQALECQRQIDSAANSLRDSERLRLNKSLVPSIDELRALTPQRFEDEIAGMFERLGYDVRQTPYSNDGGRDAILTKDGQTYLVECKRYADGALSGRPDLQKFHSAIVTDGATSGFFVTAGRFTLEAIKFASMVPIKLIDRDALVRLMFDSKPAAAEDDTYRSMCRTCQDIVLHRLRAPQSVICRNGHEVEPTLDVTSLLWVSEPAKTYDSRPKARWRRRKARWH
jgi:HJR/Mrr/RecB family endonuclease